MGMRHGELDNKGVPTDDRAVPFSQKHYYDTILGGGRRSMHAEAQIPQALF